LIGQASIYSAWGANGEGEDEGCNSRCSWVWFFFFLLFLASIECVSCTSSSLYQCFDMPTTIFATEIFLRCPTQCIILILTSLVSLVISFSSHRILFFMSFLLCPYHFVSPIVSFFSIISCSLWSLATSFLLIALLMSFLTTCLRFLPDVAQGIPLP
jgi:hypothetical protein